MDREKLKELCIELLNTLENKRSATMDWTFEDEVVKSC